MPYLGEIAALITSITFAGTSTLFTFAGRQLSSVIVNRTRLVLAVLLLMLTHWVMLGRPFPLDAEPERWLWLGLSGVVGLALGDAFLFQAFVWVGPRISMLMMSLAPVLAALMGWVWLGEQLSGAQMLGILLTVGGVAWVISERKPSSVPASPAARPPYHLRGILFAFGGAVGQALGMILAKRGLGGDFSPISANLIRMITATVVIWGYTIFRGQSRETVQRLFRHRRAALQLLGGAFIGPFIGVSFSMLALQHTEVGVASTIMALTPIFLLPVGYLVFRERLGKRAIAGTLLAIVGVGILFLV